MYEYFERKLNWLRDNYDKDEFTKVYALAIREKANQTQEVMHNIAKLFSDFVNEKKIENEANNIAKKADPKAVKKLEKLKINKQNPDKKEKKEDKKHPIAEAYKDKNDYNQLQWGGTRSSSRLFEHPMRTAPMFFRRDGSPFDITNMYQGGTVFLINNGPSFKDVDHSKLKQPGIITYGINNGAHVFRPNIWSCVDDPTRFLESIWADPTIMKIIPQAHFEKYIWDKQQDKKSDKLVGNFPNVVGFRRNEKFDADKWLFEDTINWGNHKDHGGGRSVLIATLRICFLLGFKNVNLLGCDFEMSEDKKYWFDEQRTKAAISNNNNSYKKMKEYFSELKPKFAEIGFNVYNLNPKSKLNVFEYKDFDRAIEDASIDDSESTVGMYVKRD